MMYKRRLNHISLLDEPKYFAEIALDLEKEWGKLAKLIPWHQFEEEYAASFRSGSWQAACSFKKGFCSLLIKEQYQFPDEETAAHIIPDLQRFIGLETFTQKSPFDAA